MIEADEVVIEAAEEAEEAVEDLVEEEAEEVLEVVLEQVLKLLSNHMRDSQEFTLSEEKKMLLEPKILLQENQFTRKRESLFKSQEKKKRLNIELGTHSDQKLLQPLLEVSNKFTSSQALRFFILELPQEQQSLMLLI